MVAWAALTVGAGCYGGADPGEEGVGETGVGTAADSADDGDELPEDHVDVLPDPNGLGVQGVRRLTQNELRWAVLDLFGIDVSPQLELLPGDDRTPFDNDYTTQFPSEALVTGFNAFAEEVAQRIVVDPAAYARVVTCEPEGPADEACLQEIVERTGRLVLRRPLSDAEIGEYTAFISEAESSGDFDVAVRMVLHALLQDVEFIYRFEIGTPVEGVPGLYRLGDHELATRLSFLLWGSVPDEELLDQADAGELGTDAGVYAQASRMLADPKADQQLQRLFAMWLDYDSIPAAGELPDKLRRETGALLRRVILEERLPWSELLTFPETFIDAELAAHYEMPSPDGEAGWVTYPPDSKRLGLLSHGSFLSGETNFGDTSPVLRGQRIVHRLLCQEIPLPPASIDNAEPPDFGGPDACKEQQFSMRDQEACSGCHALMDNVGFGLEAFGPAGEFREHEVDRPDCPISGDGALPGQRAFNGPGELGSLLAESGEVESCFVEHFLQLAVGRPVLEEDDAALTRLVERFEESEFDFVALMVDLASSEAMRYRVVEQP